MKVSSEALLIMDLVRRKFYLTESCDVCVGRGFDGQHGWIWQRRIYFMQFLNAVGFLKLALLNGWKCYTGALQTCMCIISKHFCLL